MRSEASPANSDAASEPAAPHVAMIVANDLSVDTRVRKMAHDLAMAGLRVTAIGMSPTGVREELTLGPARVVRLPVPELLRFSGPRLSRSRNRHLLARMLQIERTRFFNHQREVGARIGWLRSDYFATRSARRNQANERHARRLQRQAARQQRLGRFGRWDRVLSSRLHSWRKGFLAWGERWREASFRRAEKGMQRRLRRVHSGFLRREDLLQRRFQRAVTAGGTADWRVALPELHDYEAVFGPELDRLRPDVIHAQDVHLLGVAARAAARGIVAGSETKLIYDSHEYIQGLATHPRTLSGWSSLEREYIHRADRVITVAPAIAERLEQDYRLPSRPVVVMNIPVVAPDGGDSIRRAAGVGDDTTLLVYSGGMDPTRGVHTLVEALGRLDERIHLALVGKTSTGYTRELHARAEEGGYADRLHFVPFVEPQHVVTYLSSATLAVHTIVSGPINHELTLPNKVFEYMHARLPIVISDCREMSRFVSDLGIGEVFVSEDPDSLAKTISVVLEDLDQYRQVYEDHPEILDEYSWRTQRRKLFQVYRDLLGPDALAEDIESVKLASLGGIR